MATTALISKKVDDLRKGDLFISCFSKADGEYPEPRMIERISNENPSPWLIVDLEGGESLQVLQGMMVIVQEEE